MAEKVNIELHSKGEKHCRIRKAYGEPGELFVLKPGMNEVTIEEARALLASPHHQPLGRQRKPEGKPVTYGQAWGPQGSCEITVHWPEPAEAAPKGR